MEIPIDDAGGGADSAGSMTSRTQTPASAWMLVFASWLIATASTLGALFFSEVMKLPPCVLCWYQRIFMFPLVLLLPIGLAAVYLQRFQIHPEERILQRRFGDAFNVYPGQVRRWLWWKSRSTMRAGVRTVRVQ